MAGKILLVVFALFAGAGGAFAYQVAINDMLSDESEKEDTCILELQSQIAALEQNLKELSEAQHAARPETELIAARLNTLEKSFSKIQEKQEQPAAGKAPKSPDGAVQASTAEGNTDQTPAVQAKRISGEELVAALQEMPDEGKMLIRKAIQKEVKRIKDEHEFKQNPRGKLEKEVTNVVTKLTTALSLTPVQVEQAKGIGAEFIDRMLEAAQTARENEDLEYGQRMKKEIETDTKRQIVEMLSPEQLDILRELDPDGIGKEYPRGF